MKNLKEIFDEMKERNAIDSRLYARYNVKAGLRNNDGTGVKVGLTKICDVVGYQLAHGHKYDIDGQLIYRGYPIQELIHSSYEHVAFLLLFGKRPNSQEEALFHDALIHSQNPFDHGIKKKNLMNALQVALLQLYQRDDDAECDDLYTRLQTGINILGFVPLYCLSSLLQKNITSYPLPSKGLAENILYILRNGSNYTLQDVQTLNMLLILHADHGGGNNSTFANIVMASTGTDIYSCLAAAIGSLKGPKHGGANIKVSHQMDWLQRQESDMDTSIQKILHKEGFDHSGLLYGIGHAIYTKSDPRCLLIKEQVKMLCQQQGKLDQFHLYEEFETKAVKTMKEKHGKVTCANIDLYSGLAYQLLQIEQELYTPLFCMSRMAGWIAHYIENRQNNRKLIRPANVYVGN